MFKKIINYKFQIIFILIICFGIYLRTRLYLFKAEFWLDEVMFALSFIDKGIGALFLPLEAEQKAPPLYLCSVYFIVKFLGFNEYSFRFISYISGCLSVIAFYFLLNAYVKDNIGKTFALFLFAISIPLIYNSAEFKPYSSDTLICILLFLFYRYIYSKNIVLIKGGGNFKQALFYTLMTVLLIFFSFPSAFIILSMVITNCIFNRKITLTSISITTGIIISGTIIYLMDTNVYPFMRNFWWEHETKSIEYMFLTSINYFMDKVGNNFSYQFLSLVLLVLIILFKETKHTAVFCLLCIAGPIIASILKLYPFEDRLVLFLLPIFLFLIAKLFDYNIFKVTSGIHEKIQKTILCVLLILIINIKIPYINYSQDRLISFCKYYDYKHTLQYRQEVKKVSLYVLNNYQKNIRILTTNEFYYYIRYYNKYYNMKKNIPITYLGWINKDEIGNTITKFIDENNGKYTMWFISRNNEYYFRNWDLKYLKEKLQERKINYGVIPRFKNTYAYILYSK